QGVLGGFVALGLLIWGTGGLLVRAVAQALRRFDPKTKRTQDPRPKTQETTYGSATNNPKSKIQNPKSVPPSTPETGASMLQMWGAMAVAAVGLGFVGGLRLHGVLDPVVVKWGLVIVAGVGVALLIRLHLLRRLRASVSTLRARCQTLFRLLPVQKVSDTFTKGAVAIVIIPVGAVVVLLHRVIAVPALLVKIAASLGRRGVEAVRAVLKRLNLASLLDKTGGQLPVNTKLEEDSHSQAAPAANTWRINRVVCTLPDGFHFRPSRRLAVFVMKLYQATGLTARVVSGGDTTELSHINELLAAKRRGVPLHELRPTLRHVVAATLRVQDGYDTLAG
ncbi:MAG: hypothetical protein AAB289_03135, partial [Chloroflexota bacterium]